MSSFGGLYVGSSGLNTSQNALNTTAHNLSNVDTHGYTRQQITQADRHYNTVGASSISMMNAGLGVTTAEVRQVRDYFLDKYYRTEAGRQSFYATMTDSLKEVETLFGELEGVSFQTAMEDLWSSFEEYDKQPDKSEYQSLLILKSSQLLERSSAVYDGLKKYQTNMNTKISDQIDRINKIGNSIVELNNKIQKIEAGGVETANDLRDARNTLIDELSTYAHIDAEENAEGIIKISLEGEQFVTTSKCYNIEASVDDITGYVTPIWPQLSTEKSQTKVFSLNNGVSSASNTDIGSLKALLLSRGEGKADYSDIEGMSAHEYNTTTGLSALVNAEAQLDSLIHQMVTKINDTFSPLTSVTDDSGNTYTVWDSEKGCVGSDGKVPGEELFTRKNCERYTSVDLTVGGVTSTYYVYNEEDVNDTTTMYTIDSLSINADLLKDESLIPHLTQSGIVSYDLADALCDLWDDTSMVINPNSTAKLTFMGYYTTMTDLAASDLSVVSSMSDKLAGAVQSIDNQRQQVVGVSSDEELTNMIKFQNAYNASSRYINVVNEMIESLLSQLGA